MSKDLINKNKAALKSLEKSDINSHVDLFKYLSKCTITIHHSTELEGSYYDHRTKQLHINSGNTKRLDNQYWRKRVMAHELAHAIHNENDIITSRNVRQDFKDMKSHLRGMLAGHMKNIHEELIAASTANDVDFEQLTDIADLLGSISDGKYGWGHSAEYYTQFNRGEGEIFAHAVVLSIVENKYANIAPAMNEAIKKLKDYILKTLEAIAQQS